MPHPKVVNHTAFAFAPMFLADANGRPVFVPLLRATFVISEDGRLRIASKQQPVAIGGEPSNPVQPASYRLEPEGMIVKPATDIVLLGHARPQSTGALETTVGLRVGDIRKTVRVVGDRHWGKRGGLVTMSSPRPIEKIPLVWERAFGGWDRSSRDPKDHRCEPRNPVGLGFRNQWNENEAHFALPNLEDPEDPIKHFDDRPRPAGFGFVSADWQPRLALAGTYDKSWMEARMPLLPTDFDPRFLNAAPADQVVAGYLRGHEEIVVTNASLRGTLAFALPGKGVPPSFQVNLRQGGPREFTPVLDTLIIDTDMHTVSTLWRVAIPVLDVPNDVESVEIEWGRRIDAADHGHAARLN